jgi:hypothetical protein
VTIFKAETRSAGENQSMSGTCAPNNAGGSWKRRLLALPLVKKAVRAALIPLKLARFVESAGSVQTPLEVQYGTLRDGNIALSKLLTRLYQESQASREEVARLVNGALPDMQAAATESREEVRRLKHRYAEFYGAIVEQLREQNRRLDQLAEQQERIVQLLTNPPDALRLVPEPGRLPQAG